MEMLAAIALVFASGIFFTIIGSMEVNVLEFISIGISVVALSVSIVSYRTIVKHRELKSLFMLLEYFEKQSKDYDDYLNMTEEQIQRSPRNLGGIVKDTELETEKETFLTNVCEYDKHALAVRDRIGKIYEEILKGKIKF